MSWIDDVPYPWSSPLARELHRQLVDTFYEPPEVRSLIKAAGKPAVTKIAFDGRSIHQIWVDVLDRAASEGGLRTLLAYLVGEDSAATSIVGFLRELLADGAPPVAARPGGPGGNDGPAVAELTRPEALLFGDDLSESVGEIPALLASIQRVMAWRGAVCHLSVIAASGSTFVGTGMLLADQRVLTNHHVVYPDGSLPVAVRAEFNFEDDAAGQKLPSTVVAADLATVASSQDDDWATFALQAAPPPGIAGFDLAGQLASPSPSERAFILQHPEGRAKRLAFVRNRISRVADRRVHYVTDTQAGSSGAPVFNGVGKLIALHRAGGTPQRFTGDCTAPAARRSGSPACPP